MEEEELTAADSDAPATGRIVAEGQMAAAAALTVAVGAESAAESAEESPVAAPLAPTDPSAFEVAADATVTVASAVATLAAAASVGDVGGSCAAVVLISSV